MSSLSPSLDAATCNILVERGRFQPARDHRGRAGSDTFKQRIAWAIPAPGPIAFADERTLLTLSVPPDGRAQCTLTTDSVPAEASADFCDAMVENAKGMSARLPRVVNTPFRVTLALDRLVGDEFRQSRMPNPPYVARHD